MNLWTELDSNAEVFDEPTKNRLNFCFTLLCAQRIPPHSFSVLSNFFPLLRIGPLKKSSLLFTFLLSPASFQNAVLGLTSRNTNCKRTKGESAVVSVSTHLLMLLAPLGCSPLILGRFCCAESPEGVAYLGRIMTGKTLVIIVSR